MLQVAIDESGSHTGSRVFAVAACLATVPQWKAFLAEWIPLYREEQPSPDHHYHAVERWCAPINPWLADMIDRHMSHVYVVTMKEAEFKEAATPKYRSQVGGSYGFLVHFCLSKLAKRSRGRYPPERMRYVLEAGHKGQSAVDRILWKIETNPLAAEHFRLDSHDWATKEMPVVHPPDLVSHEYASCFEAPRTAVLDKLRKRTEWYHATPEDIRHHVSKVAWYDTRAGRPAGRALAPPGLWPPPTDGKKK